jgi:hypothetical protein
MNDKNDRFAALKAKIETAMDKNRDSDARWQCPRCKSGELMMHLPVWLTASVDQDRDADEPCLGDDQDVYEEIKSIPIDYDCIDCGLRFHEPVRAGAETDG